MELVGATIATSSSTLRRASLFPIMPSKLHFESVSDSTYRTSSSQAATSGKPMSHASEVCKGSTSVYPIVISFPTGTVGAQLLRDEPLSDPPAFADNPTSRQIANSCGANSTPLLNQ